jgi:phosphoglycolate phosphatase-like HAD superfamily hydrolase
MRIDHIVWDWNGTLFDDSEALVRATVEAFARSGLPEVTWAAYQEHFTRPISDFYDRLAGRTLTADEQRVLDRNFHDSYTDLLAKAVLHAEAVEALTAWRDTGGTQSLLSMFPHARLVALAQFIDIAHFFSHVDGMRADESPRKEPHLRRHLAGLGISPEAVLVIGDSLDDVHAARACGVRAVLYHPAERALVSQVRVSELDVPVVRRLSDAVRSVLTWEHHDA